ncbi:ZP4 protein, partial [Polypterus senegalus]
MGFLTIAARRSGSVAERCAVAAGEKLPCGGSSSITQADCEANNCCYDLISSTSPCYYANDVTVQCTLDGQFVVVVSEKVTLPPLDLGSLQLVDSSSPSCGPVTSLSSFVMYQFPVSACGSTVQLAGGNVTYQNTMSAAIAVRSGPDGSITRDSVYKLFFQCTYSGSQDVQVEAEVYTVAPPLPVVEQGPFDLELVIATDSSYGSYYVDADYPVTKTLRDPVAVEVHIMNRTDPNLVLTLGDCWVTPGPSASSQPQWSLLVNGCPYTGDNYLTSMVTVDSTSGVAYPSHYKRFVFEMFAFVDPVARQALAEKQCFAADLKMPPLLHIWWPAVIVMSLFQLAGGNVTYQNTMSAAITVRSGPEGSITRDSFYKLFFQCTYSGSQDVQVEAEVYTVAPPLPVVEQGPFDLELVIATGIVGGGVPVGFEKINTFCEVARRSGSVAERCAVTSSEKLPCGPSALITQADCEAINCCYDSQILALPCYYANDVTVQCTLDGRFVVVVSEKVTLPPLDLGSIQLVDSSSPSCSPVTSLSTFVVYQFPVSSCGSTVQLAGGNVTYQNTMSAAITVRSGPDGSITRDSVYKLFFQCTYSGSQDVQVEAEVYTVAPPLPVVEQGPFDLELVIATDSSYGSYYVDADYPVTKTLRDPVAVEVHIVNRTDPNLVLTLGDCWVTPGPSASIQPQWSLLVNGCPYTGDNYLTSLVSVVSTSGVAYPSHYKRFVFEMFAFVDPVARQALAEQIFIYCVAAACYPSATDPCTQSCPARRSGRAADKLAQITSSRKNVLLHSGPVVIEAEQVQTSRMEQEVTVQCTLDGQFVVVVSEKVTLPPLDLGSIQLVDSSSPSCSPVTSLSSFVMYQFPVSACGSTVQLAGGNVTYQNTMSAAITVRTGPEGSITRDSVYKLFFQCTYSGSQDVQVEAEVYTVAPPLPVVEQGPFDLELVIATDSSYGSYYVDADYPVTKTLRDPVAVEVHIMNRTDPNLVLTLGDCWVTPGPSASSQPQCPYTGDNYLTSLVTVDSTSGVAYPSHYKRFVFEMFAFVDPVARQALAEKIFIYCVAAACYPSATDPCTQSCPARTSLPTGYLVLGAAAAMLMVVLSLAVVAVRRLNRQKVNLKF